jgi:hypothetical protein
MILFGGVPIVCDAFAQVDLSAYRAQGGTPAQCRTDVMGALAPVGTVRDVTVTFRPAGIGLDSIAMQIAWSPTANIERASADARILVGVNWQPVVAHNAANPAAIAVGQQSTTLQVLQGVGTSYVIDEATIRPDNRQPLVAAPADTAFSTANTLLATQQSTDAGADNATPLGAGIRRAFDSPGIDTLEIIGVVILGIAALVAVGYALSAVAKVRG